MTTTLFPGTFDPVHNGHIDLIERAVRFCDRLVVGVAGGHHKNALFTLEERVRLIEEVVSHLPGVEVLPFDGLLVAFAQSLNARLVLRGLRALSDYDWERRMAFMNRRMDPKVEVVFLPADERYACVNSTLVQEIARLGGDVSPFVPTAVLRRMQAKLKETS